MAKTVQRHTCVNNPETQAAVWFAPGDKLPEWAEKLITNPRVFEGGGDDAKLENVVTTTAKAAEYGDMNISELDLLLEERELAKSGNKGEKIERLKASDAAFD